MKRILAALAAVAALAFPSDPAQAQSGCPSIVNGAVLTAAQWNACFAAKNNTLGFIPVNKAGDVMTGQLGLPATTTAKASLNVPPGTAPTSPINGDFWTTTVGVFARVNGVTVQLGVSNGITALTGDVTASGTGSVAATLATVNANVGTFGDSSHVGAFTVNGKGLITAASSIAVTPATIGAVPTSRTVTAGTGLSGGGALSGDITLTMANTAVAAASYGDSSHSGTFTVDAQGRLTAASSVAITPASISAVPTTRTISTATGLTGGGDLSANRTIDYDIPSLTVEGSVDPLTTFALCETAGVTKKCTAGSLAAAATAGVASLGGATGALSLSSGLSIVGSTLTTPWNVSGSALSYSAGNVGIGTPSPLLKLTLLGTAAYNESFGAAGTFYVGDITTPAKGIDIGYDPTVGAGFIQAAQSGVGYKPLLLSPNGGNVGIGTITPSQLLEVAAASDPVIQVTSTGLPGSIQMGVNTGNNAALFQATNALDIKFFNGQYGLTIKGSNGYLGVLNTTPTAALDVVNSVNDFAQGIRILNANVGLLASAAFVADNGTYQGFFGIRGTGASSVGILVPNVTEVTSLSTSGIAIGALAGPILFSANGTLSEDMRIATSGNVGILSATPVALLSVGALGSVPSTNSGTGVVLSGTTVLGTTVNAVNYIGEFRNSTVNESRLMVMGYRRVADGSWQGTGWRLQTAVDNSFTAYNSGLTYLEFANAPAIYFGLSGIDAVTINTNGVGIGKVPTYSLDIAGSTRSDVAYFKQGKPWADIVAWGGIGNGSFDNTTIIQAAIDYMYNNYGGGIVFFPPGNYVTTGVLTVKGAVRLQGTTSRASAITFTSGDGNVITFDNTVNQGGLKDIAIYGYQNAAATLNAVTVQDNAQVNMSDCIIWGGNFALYTRGVDGHIFNCFISGWGPAGGAVRSQGANWYQRVKMDTTGQHAGFGFKQETYFAAGASENHFTDCDFSGDYNYSLHVDDSNTGSAIVVSAGGVFSGPILVNFSKWVGLLGNEIVGPVTQNATNVGPITITGSYGFSGWTLGGGGTNHVCSGNFNITC